MRNVLLNLMVILSVFSVQGCWAGGTKESDRDIKAISSNMVDSESPKVIENVDAEKDYPPYPDVWGRLIPAGRWAYFETPNNDIFIEYEVISAAPNFLANGVYFFDEEIVNNSSFHREQYKPIYQKLMLQLPSGKVGPSIRLDVSNFAAQSSHCPLSLRYSVKYPNKKPEIMRLLYLLDKPHEQEINDECGSLEKHYQQKLVAISAKFLPLEDGTFLVFDEEHGIAIRFNDELESKSDLVGEKLFWVKANDLEDKKTNGVNYQLIQENIIKRIKK